jgi:polysaccharide biosynthesis/export protein
MQRLRRALLRAGVLAGIGLALGACTLPRSGPTAGEILSASTRAEGGFLVVPVTPSVAAASRAPETLGFGRGLDRPRPRLGRHDRGRRHHLGHGLGERRHRPARRRRPAGLGAPGAPGRRERADLRALRRAHPGRRPSPEALRRAITASLAERTPDPQVEVRRIAGDGAMVSVMGGVASAGVYPIEPATRRLSGMLARAGGVALEPDVAQIQLRRGGRTGQAWLQDVYDVPAFDVALRPGDRIVVEEDRRAFTALGAAGRQARLPFSKRDMTALEALAAAGGLDGRAADPTGVFIFRRESAEVARAVSGQPDIVGPQRVAYVLDFTRAEGLLSAREFVIRDEDTLYVTEAPIASWSRVIGIAGARSASAARWRCWRTGSSSPSSTDRDVGHSEHSLA